jgi:hypothetical protein
LAIFNLDSWSDVSVDDSLQSCRARFLLNYQSDSSPTLPDPAPSSSPRFPSVVNDFEFQQHLAKISTKRRRLDYDRYIEVPQDPSITSVLMWWKKHEHIYPDLANMARDILAVPASGCPVERVFSISGRIARWERSSLRDSTISDSMMVKDHYLRAGQVLKEVDSSFDSDDDCEYEVSEVSELGISSEWEENWWLDNVKSSKSYEI